MLNMITEEDKYKSQTFRIFGIGMTVPFGSIFLDPLSIIKTYGIKLFVFYVLFTIVLALLGLVFIERGRVIIHERKFTR